MAIIHNVFCIWIQIFENNFKNKRGEKLFLFLLLLETTRKEEINYKPVISIANETKVKQLWVFSSIAVVMFIQRPHVHRCMCAPYLTPSRHTRTEKYFTVWNKPEVVPKHFQFAYVLKQIYIHFLERLLWNWEFRKV